MPPLPNRAALPGPVLGRDWYRGDSLDVAPALLNKLLVADDGRAARLVEVEAYRGQDDPGSHSFRGRTTRNAAMWGPPGRLYVYFTYGMHWCANVVCGPEGLPHAVLLRAAEPVSGTGEMLAARRARAARAGERDLCRGPARLCQAFGIGAGHDGADLVAGPYRIVDDGVSPPSPPAAGPRVGLRAAADRPWRLWVPGHPGVSDYRPAAPSGKKSAARLAGPPPPR